MISNSGVPDSLKQLPDGVHILGDYTMEEFLTYVESGRALTDWNALYSAAVEAWKMYDEPMYDY